MGVNIIMTASSFLLWTTGNHSRGHMVKWWQVMSSESLSVGEVVVVVALAVMYVVDF